MTRNLNLLTNFVEKFLGMVKFRNDQIAPILGYGDLVQGTVTNKRVYYVKWLNHNLFSVSQFCDADLEVAFRKSTCYIRDLKGNDLLTESINGKKYVVVIIDDYSRYTWTHFLRSKDETPEVLIDFLILVQRGLHAQVRMVRTDKGTEFLNKTLHAYFATEGIEHQTSVTRTPEQNGVVERRNRTLVEAARTMLSAAKVPLFFWAEAIATTCFTQNRSLVIPRHEKIPYHIINDRKPSVKFFHIFGSLCYIVRDSENLDKMKEKGDACIFVGYSTQSRAYRVFHKRTRVIVESIHVNFDELPQMVSDHVKNAQVEDDKFINIFCTPIQDQREPSSRHVDSSNMHTLNQRHPSKHHWTKDYPLEQVIGNTSQSVRTRRQLESDGEMYMFAFTVSRTEPKNIKEAMADSVWIELMQEELHLFDRLDDCTSMSLVEAEYVSLSACCAQVLWLRTQLTDYGFHFDKIPMYCDSKVAIAISCNPVQHSRTKHIDVRYYLIKEKVEKGIVELFFVGTEYQLADLFTKALSEDRFKYLVRRLGMRCLTTEELEVRANESA
nr:retrovirus-related Pol polyprotein from transposon TNT 1-94 [Tanacetum cinerariifolium]GEY55116.1 retrovirus-related Pol polyprotein from transposon TNT 1-94 [Tanacetum cinerariifolium]